MPSTGIGHLVGDYHGRCANLSRPFLIYGYGSCYSPVLIDTEGDGFALTDAAGGVLFDLDGNPDKV